MAISDYKIKPADISAVCVENAPDVLTGSPTQNKQVFDEYSDMIVEKFNDFVDFYSTQDINEISEEVIEEFKRWGWEEPTA